jgi:hypothetical protein
LRARVARVAKGSGMANLQLYALFYVYIDFQLLAEEQEVTVSRNTHANIVNTVPKGMAGVSPGSPMCQYNVKQAIPQDGSGFDAGKKMIGLVPTKIYIVGAAGTQLRGEGFIISDTFQHAVNQEAVYTFECVGPMNLFQV